MPYIVIFSWYPPHIVDEVVKVYLESLQKQPIPSYVKRLVPVAGISDKDGFFIINVDEVKQDDLGKAMNYADKFMANFARIEGFRSEIKIFSTISESLENLGIS